MAGESWIYSGLDFSLATKHYGHFTWVLGPPKLLATWLFVQQSIQVDLKPSTVPLWGKTLCVVASPNHSGAVMWKVFPSYGVVMNSPVAATILRHSYI